MLYEREITHIEDHENLIKTSFFLFSFFGLGQPPDGSCKIGIVEGLDIFLLNVFNEKN